jgi:uncharacterized radical SAM superfamily protein
MTGLAPEPCECAVSATGSDVAGIDAALVARLRRAGARFDYRPFRASTPSFRDFESDELGACKKSGRFPAFSITGGTCALDCKHCRASILRSMTAAGDPAQFEAMVRTLIERQGLQGFLLSGGSNRRNEVPFDRYLPVIRRLKTDFPALEVLVHTALVDARRADALKAAGVDVAMMDMIGADATIGEVYHLDRPVEDFEATLKHLVAAGLNALPHVVIGLHHGRILGEKRALEIIARYPTQAAILVVLMPAFADPGFGRVDIAEALDLIAEARGILADRLLLLGCARPPGRDRVMLDVGAVLAGVDGIAYPADEAMAMARTIGRPTTHAHACCGTQSCQRAA